MGILKSAARGLRNLTRKGKGKSLGEWFSQSRLNPGSWGEDIASGLGVRTRGPMQYKNVGRPEKRGPKFSFGSGGGYEPDALLEKAIPSTGGYRNLTGAGYAAQAGGYGALGGLGAYMMSGEPTPKKDARGTPNKGFDEKRAKAVDDYKQTKLLGSSGFNAELYGSVTKDSQWVKTAVDNMGKERYMQLRRAALKNPNAGQAVHDELVKALAKTADTKALEKAIKEPYVLPGLARTEDGKPRVVVISPVKGDDKSTSYTALQFDWQEPEGQE